MGLSTTQVQLLVLYTPNLQIYKLLVLSVSTRSTSTQGFSDSTGTFSVLQQNRHVFSWLAGVESTYSLVCAAAHSGCIGHFMYVDCGFAGCESRNR